MSDEKLYWVAFSLVKGIGAVRFRRLLDEFGTLEKAWQASPAALEKAGLSQQLVQNLIKIRSEVHLNQYAERLKALGIDVLTWQDEGYPRRLIEIDQPPPVLYVRGELKQQDEVAVAVVGTRRVTRYGTQVTQEIAVALAQNGVCVVSGMARGVDALAHSAAMEAGGRTIAVLGSGLDQIYPPEHRTLAERIVRQGALISDYPPGTKPDATNFPPRNRIISGLSLAVVVVEAGEKSGALITASFAADQGRDVFAVPGNIKSPQSAGTNRLIQKGAFPFVTVEDLLEVLDITVLHQQQAARKILPTDPMEAQIYDVLQEQPLHVDEISRLAKLPVAQVTSTLTLMELKGLAKAVGGMSYVAARESGDEYHVSRHVEENG